MATPRKSDGRRESSDGEVFHAQSDGEWGRYNSVLSGRTPPPATSGSGSGTTLASARIRPRIPSLKEVTEKSEGPNWTMSSPAQNLAAALNDPANREYDLFTKSWGMYFVPNSPLPPSTLPNIQLRDFLRYLKETAAGRKVHRSIVRQLRKESNGEETPGVPSSPSSPALPPLISQLQQDGRMYDLSSVPRFFMQADFSLADQATFQQILPLDQFMTGRRGKKAREQGGRGRKVAFLHEDDNDASLRPISSKLLHEKLSHYLDVIEVHLAHQIAQRSDLFFSTLSSQQELQTHIMTVRQSAVELRLCLRELDKKLTHQKLELLQLCTQRHRHAQVLQKLKLIATVQQTQPTIQLLLSTSDFVGAIDLITTTQDVLQNDLRGVHSLRHLGSQLAEMKRAIEKMMEADLVHFALEDIGLRDRAPSSPSLSSDITTSEERLVSVVYGLLMQSKLHFLAALREGILTHLKTFVKETVKSYLHIQDMDGDSMDSPSLADCMRGMEFDAWLAMMDHLFQALLQHLQTVQSCVKVIATVCERAAGRPQQVVGVVGVVGGMAGSGGGAVQQRHATRQQSQDQLATSALVRETLRKNSTITSPSSLATSQSTTDFQLKPTATPTSTSLGSSVNLPSFDSFDKTAAECEAEEQLELLMMQEEMSELRIAVGTGSVDGTWMIQSTQHHQLANGPVSSTAVRPFGSGSLAGEDDRASDGGSAVSKRASAGDVNSQLNKLNSAPSLSSSFVSQLSSGVAGTCTAGGGGGTGGVGGSGGSGTPEGGLVGGVIGGVALMATTAGQLDVRSQQLTVDSKEKERLEDIMAIAHVDGSAQVISQAECQKLVTECHELLAKACDLVHGRCAKILGIRAKAGLLENVATSQFVSLVRLIERFVHSCTDVTGRQCPTLRSSLLSQSKAFVEHFHESRKSKVSLLLDGERWKQTDVPAEIQALVHRLETGIPPMSSNSRRESSPECKQLVQSGQQANKYLVVHNQSFAVLGIVPLLVKIVLEYCLCADDLPNLVSEIMTKLVETLKFFNGRTCMLVLGAGAVETVGLKTITARHLALVLRCLQAVRLLIPDIRKHFQWRLPQKQHILLTHFDHVTEDFGRHCIEINNKIKTIMDDLISRHLSKWEAKSPVPSVSFKTLIKQVVKLHENLVDILPHTQLQSLFASIEDMFKNHLRLQLQRLGITNNGSTQHGIVNSELTYFMGALGSLENTNAFRSSLFDVWTVN